MRSMEIHGIHGCPLISGNNDQGILLSPNGSRSPSLPACRPPCQEVPGGCGKLQKSWRQKVAFGKTVVASDLTGSRMAGAGRPYQKCPSKNSRLFNLGEHAFQHAQISGPPSPTPHGFQGFHGYPSLSDDILGYPWRGNPWTSMQSTPIHG